MQKDYFSTDYSSARIAFRRASAAAGAALSEHRISAMGPAGESLSIDVARLGEDSAAAVLIVSSGVHGVEGLFGSAVQLAWLDSLRNRPPPTGLRIVLLHAVNPFGFAWRRRWDEDGVDLNRNFLHEGEQYCGSPPRASPTASWPLSCRPWPAARRG